MKPLSSVLIAALFALFTTHAALAQDATATAAAQATATQVQADADATATAVANATATQAAVAAATATQGVIAAATATAGAHATQTANAHATQTQVAAGFTDTPTPSSTPTETPTANPALTPRGSGVLTSKKLHQATDFAGIGKDTLIEALKLSVRQIKVIGTNATALGFADIGNVTSVIAFTTSSGAAATQALLVEGTDYTVANGDITPTGDARSQTWIITYRPWSQ